MSLCVSGSLFCLLLLCDPPSKVFRQFAAENHETKGGGGPTLCCIMHEAFGQKERKREREEWVARCTTHCFWQSSIILLNSSGGKGEKKRACNPRERERENQSLGPKPSSLLQPPTDDNCQGGREGAREGGRKGLWIVPFFF
jgi:hypothetical protein